MKFVVYLFNAFEVEELLMGHPVCGFSCFVDKISVLKIIFDED
jgi:hypothetical protein